MPSPGYSRGGSPPVCAIRLSFSTMSKEHCSCSRSRFSPATICRPIYPKFCKQACSFQRLFRENKGLASFLTAFVENLGKTSPPEELHEQARRLPRHARARLYH